LRARRRPSPGLLGKFGKDYDGNGDGKLIRDRFGALAKPPHKNEEDYHSMPRLAFTPAL